MTANDNYPTQYECRLTLKNGREVFLRPIKPADTPLVVDLFKRLSTQSIYLRFLRHLHDLPQDMLYRFTHLDYHNEFALVGLVEEDGRDAIIAVARYAHTPHDQLTDLALAVRDDWQHLGLGTSLLKKIIEIGKEHGFCRFDGMIDLQNKIITRILMDIGCEVKHSLRDGFIQVEIRV